MGLKSYVCNMPEKLFGAFCLDFNPGWLFELVHTSFITFLCDLSDIDSSDMGILLDRYVCNMPVKLFGAFCLDFSPVWLFERVHTLFFTFDYEGEW